MKRLVAMMMCAVCLSLTAQEVTFYDYPFNPDANGDDFVGVADLQSFLASYGQPFGLPPQACDYDGSALEEWWGSVIAGDVIVDSLFMEFNLVDSAQFYYPGCPDPVNEIVELAFAEMLETSLGASPFQGTSLICYTSFNGPFYFNFNFIGSNGRYEIEYLFQGLTNLGYEGDGFFGNAGWTGSSSVTIPFPSDMTMDENGIHLGNIWTEAKWPYYATEFHILPYWHYAE